jgi:hypothetical protein
MFSPTPTGLGRVSSPGAGLLGSGCSIAWLLLELLFYHLLQCRKGKILRSLCAPTGTDGPFTGADQFSLDADLGAEPPSTHTRKRRQFFPVVSRFGRPSIWSDLTSAADHTQATLRGTKENGRFP